MSERSPLTILVVEDDEVTRYLFEQFVLHMPETDLLRSVDNGRDGVEAALELKPDIILMDISMNKMDGVEATRKIKGECPECKVLIITAHSDDDRVIAAFSAGADGYCTKPIDFGRLSLAIQSIATGACWLDPAIAEKVVRANRMARQQQDANKDVMNVFGLSPRELEVLTHITLGRANYEIAAELEISCDTVKRHVRNLLNKLAVADRTQAAVKAIRHGFTGDMG